MNAPETLHRINAALLQRVADGKCATVAKVAAVVLRDDDVGLYLRLTFHLEDGDSFEIDTQEANKLLAPIITH